MTKVFYTIVLFPKKNIVGVMALEITKPRDKRVFKVGSVTVETLKPGSEVTLRAQVGRRDGLVKILVGRYFTADGGRDYLQKQIRVFTPTGEKLGESKHKSPLLLAASINKDPDCQRVGLRWRSDPILTLEHAMRERSDFSRLVELVRRGIVIT